MKKLIKITGSKYHDIAQLVEAGVNQHDARKVLAYLGGLSTRTEQSPIKIIGGKK